jgi:hypothetical protein
MPRPIKDFPNAGPRKISLRHTATCRHKETGCRPFEMNTSEGHIVGMIQNDGGSFARFVPAKQPCAEILVPIGHDQFYRLPLLRTVRLRFQFEQP